MDMKHINKSQRGDNQSWRPFMHWEIIAIYLVVFDIFAVNFSYFMGLFLRFDFRFSQIPKAYLLAFLKFSVVYTAFCLIVFALLKLYSSLWRFAGFNELNRIVISSLITTIFHLVFITAIFKLMPIAYYVVGATLQFCLITGVRFSYRFINLERKRRQKTDETYHRAMIIGAGEAGLVVIKELKKSLEAKADPICVIDDNPNKWGRLMEGIKVVGGRESILSAVKTYHIDQILFAIPTASMEDKREILNICKDTGCELKSLPGIYQLTNGEVSLSRMKPVAVEDLLGRDTIRVDMDEIGGQIKDKVVLVTGGGGSIGSELCRQIASHLPKMLVIFDIYENNAYEIEQDIKLKYGPDFPLVTLIGSVRDRLRLHSLFDTYRPDLVFHAAAHKHVPLMESSPNEAIKNNVMGTFLTAREALLHKVQRFVLISTDKAVNPTNIMGASKRLCEMVIQSLDAISRENRLDLLPMLEQDLEGVSANSDYLRVLISQENKDSEISIKSVENTERKGTQFAAVRFGNVLGSNGSVIPLFKKQIKAGGPVTVTHPDIIRYFMTIPEAVSLVLQASVYAWGGEIFVLDMGEPVKIDTLARNVIKLSGFKPDIDIKITYTGLRPGEKLYEEKLMAEEGIKKTQNKLIHIGKPIAFDILQFFEDLKKLDRLSRANSPLIVDEVKRVVTTFKSPNL